MSKVILDDVIDVISGGTPKTSVSEYWENGVIGWLSINDFNDDYRKVYKSEKKITEKGLRESSTKLLNVGDLIISARGTVGVLAQIGTTMAFNQSCFGLRGKDGIIDNTYLYYALKNYVSNITKRGQGSVFNTINLDSFKIMEIDIEDDFKNQQKIASVLAVLDDKIELNQKIKTELEAMTKVLYDYWFVQFDFPDKNGKPYKSSGGEMTYNEQLKREIPESWRIDSLSNLTSVLVRGISPKYIEDAGIPVINQKCIRNNSIDFSLVRRHDFLHKKVDSKLIQVGDILVNSTGVGTLGRVAVVKRLEEPVTTADSHVTIVRIDNKKANPNYIGYTVTKKQNEIEQLGEGSTGQTELSRENLGKLVLLIPDNDIQLAFEKFLIPIQNKIAINEKESLQLAQLRDWLLPMLMNGQIKLADNYEKVEKAAGSATGPLTKHEEQAQLFIPDNKKGFAKQVLAGKIISLFKDDPNFTDIKFQKIQFLAEHIIEADLHLNYYYQAAGPYDNKFMHSIYNDLKKNKWFDRKNKQFIPLEKQVKIEDYYQGYFGSISEQLDNLFNLLSNATEAESEIVATLYAVWNNKLIEGETFIDKELIEDFYSWSNRKQKYTEEQVLGGLKWLRDNKMEPKGFGKLIKKAKGK